MSGKRSKEIRRSPKLFADSPKINFTPPPISTQVIQQEGPLPPPAILKDYDKAFPGCAKIIVDMAINEQTHRHNQENILNENICAASERMYKNNRFVLWFAVFVYITLTGIGVWMALLEQPYLAAICFGTPLFEKIAKFFHKKTEPPTS